MSDLINEILKLKREKNAVILAHNYQIPEIQDIADFVGDSLGLSQQAASTNAELIVFCGVHFMAETASIIAPNKKVIIPDLDAGCSLAASITVEQLREWKKQFPDAVVVAYINTTAEIKAETDYCVTSSNAVKVVEAIPRDKKILFLPDRFLGQYVSSITGREMEIWKGACHVHEKIGDIDFAEVHAKHPNAEFLIHPECGCSTSCMMKSRQFPDATNIHIHSTEGMINFVKSSDKNEFVIATEVGILHRLKKINPEALILPLSENSVCEYMKMITIEKLCYALQNEKFEVRVPEELAAKARIPIERMLAIV
ncbi:MAG: quinolinate synthase NadA [Ignavibacteriaceae bacterium]|nr:quinolinate synthase NadA [Ignavibacteriaceae bacterium]